MKAKVTAERQKGIFKMRGFKNYNDIPEYTDSLKLPVGAYEIKIIRAEEQDGANNSCALCIIFDIADGEYKSFYMDKFKSEKKAYPDDAKFKGVLRLWYPNGGQYDESNEKRIKTTLERIKQSNNLKVDFSKEWDGAVLKDCKVGMVFREQEYDYNGRQGMTVQPYQIITLEALKEGKFTIPSPKYLNGSAPNANTNTAENLPLDDDDLPF